MPRFARRYAVAGTLSVGVAVLAGLPNLSAGALPGLPALPGVGVGEVHTSAAPTVAVPVPVVHKPRRAPAAAPRQAADPTTTPPLHGSNPHGQGSVAVVDTNPDPKRPYSGDPTGTSDGEDVVVGRSRGEQGADGSYHGHVTVAAVMGNEIAGVDTKPGETKHGPLDAVQTSLLDQLCGGSGNQLCISILPANSATTSNGSTNHFGVAHANAGGPGGIDAGIAESNGNISSDGSCQTSHGDSSAANVTVGGQAVASVANSSTDSSACGGQGPAQRNASSVLMLGGAGVPIPAPGCADGTADTLTGIPTLLPLVCNGDDSNAGQGPNPYGARDALDAFVLSTGTTSAARLATSGSESQAVAPAGAAQTAPPPASAPADVAGSGVTPAKKKKTTPESASGVKSVGANGTARPTKAVRASGGSLPFTGTDILELALIGALLLAAGLALRGQLPRRHLQS